MKETYFADLPTDSNYLQGEKELGKNQIRFGPQLNTSPGKAR